MSSSPSDMLLPIAAFLTFQNVFVMKFVVCFVFPQEVLLSTTSAMGMAVGGSLLTLGSALETSEALQSLPLAPCQFHL